MLDSLISSFTKWTLNLKEQGIVIFESNKGTKAYIAGNRLCARLCVFCLELEFLLSLSICFQSNQLRRRATGIANDVLVSASTWQCIGFLNLYLSYASQFPFYYRVITYSNFSKLPPN